MSNHLESAVRFDVVDDDVDVVEEVDVRREFYLGWE